MSATNPELQLRVFGGLEVHMTHRPGAETLLRQPKRLGLLLYLILHPDRGFVSRDQLLAVFWPESSPDHAQANLRQSLHFLRDALPRDVLLSRGRHALGVDRDRIDCDVWDFVRLAQEGRPADALALYSGELLAGFHFSHSTHPFEEWLHERRSTLQTRAAQLAWRMADESERAGRPQEAAFWGKRALSHSMMSEPGVQHLMRLLHRVGDRAGALRAYRGLESWLAREFDAEPSPETRALAEAVRLEPPPHERARLFGDRRSGVERRSGEDRRRESGDRAGPERRSGSARRSGEERRSGRDRRGDRG